MWAPPALFLLLALVLAALAAFAAFAPAAVRGRAGVRGGGGARPEIAWPRAAPVPPALVAEAGRRLREVPGFGPAPPEAVAGLAAELSEKHGHRVSPETLLGLRTMRLALEMPRDAARVRKASGAIRAARRAGKRALEIAGALGLPPMGVVRELGRLGLPADAREAGEAAEADLGSRPNADRIRRAAGDFEDRVEAAVRVAGVVPRTEADLRRAPDPRGPELTPDLLLAGPARIHGREVNWIDAKNYMLADQPLVLGSLKKQAAKYVRAFGPGAFVFSGGAVRGSRLAATPGLLILDGSHLFEAPGQSSRG